MMQDPGEKVIPGQLGEFAITLDTGCLFMVNGSQGNSNNAYVCFTSKLIEMYHCGLVPVPLPNPPLRLEGVLPNHLKCTLYASPNNLCQQSLQGQPNRGMVSVAIQIKKCPEQGLKRIRLAVGLQLTTLRHYTVIQQHAWYTQLVDMLDVLDYPVDGYKPSSNITGLHVHLWDCSVDYRPLNIPHRAVVTVSTFMISSNLTTAISGCTLRFVAEDCTLSLAPYSTKRNGTSKKLEEHKITVLPAALLICVVELGLFEISLRLSERATISFPKYDLRAAINDVHIRTCSDSGRVLAQFLSYIASEGDLIDTHLDESTDDSLRFSKDDTGSLSEKEDIFPTFQEPIPEEQQHAVNNLLIDAMEDYPHATGMFKIYVTIQILGVNAVNE